MSDGGEIIDLGAHERMTVEQALTVALRRHIELSDVIIVGYDKNGELFVNTSHMTREVALWIAMALVDYTRGK